MPVAIIPRPVSCIARDELFTLAEDTAIVCSPGAGDAGEALRAALGPLTGPRLAGTGQSEENRIVLTIDRSDARLGEEGYRLSVNGTGLELRAASRLGLLHGVQTLRQLLPPEAMGGQRALQTLTLPAVEIVDWPRFSWRGAHLDVARHFLPTSFLLRFLDLLALHKLNVLHLHLTDDQGWRMEVRKYPKLTEIGAWRRESMIGHPWEGRFDGRSHGGFYTQGELREVVEHAGRLGITVVPEIDLPGHSQAAIASYPELGNCPDRHLEVATRWGGGEDVLNVEDTTVHFFQDVLAEALDIFPGPFIHVGGDECPKGPWRRSPRAQAKRQVLGLADEDQLQSWFIGQMAGFLSAAGRRLVGWDEILEGGLAPGAIVMSWRGEEGGIAAARAGHDVVMTPESHTYFDWAQSSEPGEPLAIGRPGERVTPLEKVYSYEPVPDLLTPVEATHVLGTQFQLWTEYMAGPAHVEYMAFPRACALAEVAWSPAEERDLSDFISRLRVQLRRLDSLGVGYRPLAGPAGG
jgi:hexosaminidase